MLKTRKVVWIKSVVRLPFHQFCLADSYFDKGVFMWTNKKLNNSVIEV